MILPIHVYGNPVLRKKTQIVTPDYPNLDKTLADIWETMYHADGVGLAAPQVGISLRIFVIDSKELFKEDDPNPDIMKQTFINPEIIDLNGDEWAFNEGCLSIPGIREDIKRKAEVRIRFVDENFQPFDKIYTGVNARVILHEYDHLEGVLFTDHLSQLRKKLLKRKLADISKGIYDVDYKTIVNKK